MTEPLATIPDLEARMERAVTETELARAATLLVDASAAVRNYTRQTISAETETARLRVRRGIIRLPQRPVTAVTAVKDMNAVDVTFQWYKGDKIDFTTQVPDTWSFEPRRTALQYVDVTYTHGYDDVPDEIVAIVCQVAARALGRPPEQSGVTSQTLGDASQSFGIIGAAGAVGLLAEERAALDAYGPRVGASATSG